MTTTVTSPPTTSRVPPLTAARAAAALLFLLWFEAGYTALLIAVGRLPVRAAFWQGALCVAAIPPLLFAVVRLIGLPKHLPPLPRAVIEAFWVFGNVCEIILPWLGWSTLLWLLNGGTWRAALRPGGGIAAFSYATGLLLLALLYPRPSSVRITRLDLPIPGLPPAFDGYTLLHVTDLHCSYHTPAGQVRARVAVGADLACDLVAYTGDTADSTHRLLEAARALALLKPRECALAVLGNHDNWIGAGAVREALTAQGFQVLVNEHIALERDGQRLYVAGVRNMAYNDHDGLPAAFAGIPEESIILLLSHAPGVVRRPLSSRAALILAGHTHGGQLVLPGLGPLYVPSRLGRRYGSGLFTHPGGWLFINRGLGEIFPPVRLLCSPEIAVITLHTDPGRH